MNTTQNLTEASEVIKGILRLSKDLSACEDQRTLRSFLRMALLHPDETVAGISNHLLAEYVEAGGSPETITTEHERILQ